jgi:hypothetical protein
MYHLSHSFYLAQQTMEIIGGLRSRTISGDTQTISGEAHVRLWKLMLERSC